MNATYSLIDSYEALNPLMKLGVVGVNLANDRTVQYRQGEVFESASTIKAFLAYQFLKERPQLLEEKREVTKQECGLAGGAGILQHLTKGTVIAWRDILMLMMSLSDNVATHILIDELGGIPNVNRFIEEVTSGDSSQITNYPGLALDQTEHFGTTTAADLLSLLRKVEEDNELSVVFHELWDDKKKGYSSRLGRNLPPSIDFVGTKGGTFSAWNAHHDFGVIETEKGEKIFVAVLTSNIEDEKGRERSHPDHRANGIIGEVACSLYDELR